jgi:polyhydroxybutyrate depolymerase
VIKPEIRTLRRAAALALTAAATAAFVPSALSAPQSAPAWPYKVYRPAGLSKTSAVPLVVVAASSISSAESTTQLDAAADRGGFVVAYAQVQKSYNDVVHQNGETASNPYPDMLFLGSVIDKVTASENIDRGHVFMTGVSLGGTLSYRAGCVLAGKLTGIAPVEAVVVNPKCRPSRPVSVFAVNGTADSSAPYNGAPGYLSVAKEIALWRGFDSCASTVKETVRGAVTTDRWNNCAKGAAVQLATVKGGDHAWSPSGLIDTTAAVTAFIKSVPRAGSRTLTAAVKHVTIKRSRSATMVLVRLHANARVSVAATVSRAGRKIYAHAFRSRPATTTLRLRLPAHLKGGVYVVKLNLTSRNGTATLSRRFKIGG